MGLLVVLVKTNSCITGPPLSRTLPKSKASSRKTRGFTCWPKPEKVMRNRNRTIIRFIGSFLIVTKVKLIQFSFILFYLQYGKNSYRYTKQWKTAPWQLIGRDYSSH